MADLATNSVLAFASWGCFIEGTKWPSEADTEKDVVYGPNDEFVGTLEVTGTGGDAWW